MAVDGVEILKSLRGIYALIDAGGIGESARDISLAIDALRERGLDDYAQTILDAIVVYMSLTDGNKEDRLRFYESNGYADEAAVNAVKGDAITHMRTLIQNSVNEKQIHDGALLFGIPEAKKIELLEAEMSNPKTGKNRQATLSIMFPGLAARPPPPRADIPELSANKSASVGNMAPLMAAPNAITAGVGGILAAAATVDNPNPAVSLTKEQRDRIYARRHEKVQRITNSAKAVVAGAAEMIRAEAVRNHSTIGSLLATLNTKEGVNNVNRLSLNASRIPSLSGEINPRNTARGWFGPKQSKSTYATYLKSVLKNKQHELKARAPQIIERNAAEIIRLTQLPKPSPAAVYQVFDTWRKSISPDGVVGDLWSAIQKVRAPGWFGVSRDYVPNMGRLVDNYTTRKGVYVEPPKQQQRGNVNLTRRGFLSRKVAPAPAPVPVFLPPVVPRTIGGYRTRKIVVSRRMAHKHRRSQRGGATPMPLAYYQPGAYETRTVEATGAGIAGSSDAWVRMPVSQTGGRRRLTQKRQAGGFSPSVMGQFANAGLRLLPVAGYMGYKMFNKKSRKAGRRTRRR
jgi:hypothetical protein